MKVCLLTHNLKQDNGAGVFSLRFIKGLQEAGHEVTVLVTEASGHSSELPILYPQKWKLLAGFFRLRKILKTCDIIHALDAYPYGVLTVLCSKGLGKKVIITAIGSGSIIPLYKAFISPIVRYCYRHADAVTAVSNYTQREILKKVPGLEIQVINHGVDLKEFEAARQKSLPSEVKQYQPYILSVGALRYRKGYKLSIAAFAEVSKKYPELKYVIIGKRYTDKFLNQLREIIRSHKLEKKVIILQDLPRDMLLEFYRGAELFGLMSQNLGYDVEGFGLVFLEAAASGLAVVGTKDTGIEDAVREGKNGFLVPPRDPHQFAEAIIKILGDEDRKAEMGEASINLARNSDWKQKVGEYLKIYKN